MLALRVAAVALLVAAVTAYDALSDVGNDFATSDDVSEDLYDIPTGFLIGAGSAAYQIEGAWNVSDKGQSIWDVFLHSRPSLANGDVACDSYDLYETDVTLLKNLKVDLYRFSLSWPRLLPDGTTSNYSQDGVDFYNNLIDLLVENDIIPVVTLYHWDLPEVLQEGIGGWLDSSIQDLFEQYARFAFETFGDRVQWWATFNEPHLFCENGYGSGTWAPGIQDPGVSVYTCAHNVILSHAKAYQAYYADYSLQGGEVGITMDFGYSTPLNSSDADDVEAAERAMIFNYAWFADPLIFGDYPDVMRTIIDANSVTEGRNESRLPSFTDDEKELILLSTDFLGVNHYGSNYATSGVSDCTSNPSYARDMDVISSGASDGGISPWGLRGVLNWIQDRYNNYQSFVTENGISGTTADGLNDYNRLSYFSGYMRATLRAVNEDLCNVIGYSLWSLMDNLEWTAGYGVRYGIHFTDYTDDDRKRTPKKSATFIKQIMRTQKVAYYAYSSD